MASDAASPDGILGQWRAAGSGRALPCLLHVNGDGEVTLSLDGKTLAVAPLSLLAVSDRVGSIARHIGFPDGSDFETADNDAIDALLRRHRGPRAGAIHRLEGFRPRLLVFVVLVIALGFGLYRFAVPLLVEVAVAATPAVVPRFLSQSVLASLDGTLLEESGLDPSRRDALTASFKTIAALTPRGSEARGQPRPETYTLNFRKGGTIGPNAFALPDGTIVLTDELVELAGDDEIVLGVLAHEIGHVDHEHSLRQLYRAAGVTGLIMLIGGDIGSGTEDLLIQGSALLALSYSREAENQADHFSVDLMHKAGKDPAAIARFFELLRDKFGDNGENDFLSTHPATPERIAETRRYAEEIRTRKP